VTPYSNEVEERAVDRLPPSESGQISRVSQELGMSGATSERWLAEAPITCAQERAWIGYRGIEATTILTQREATTVARLEMAIATPAMHETQRSPSPGISRPRPANVTTWTSSPNTRTFCAASTRMSPCTTARTRAAAHSATCDSKIIVQW